MTGPCSHGSAAAVTAARGAGVPVIFVRVAFRPGYPEASPRNKGFGAIAEHAGDAFTVHGHATQVHAALGPASGEPVVVKKRVSALAAAISRCCCAHWGSPILL